MTLYLELFDSEIGDLIAKALDRKIDNPSNSAMYTWASSAKNKGAADRILAGWANILLAALNEAKTTPALPLPLQCRYTIYIALLKKIDPGQCRALRPC